MTKFGEALESVQALPAEEQEDLVGIVQRQLNEQRRAEIETAISESQAEFAVGDCQPATVDEIISKAGD